MLAYVLKADHKERIALTEQLKPTEEDCMTLFSAVLGEKVYRYQKKLDRQARIIVRPLLSEQTDILLWSATVEELRTMTGDARCFPGGYHEIAEDMAAGYTLYRFKFVQPGRSLGSAYDMLVFVNGHWRLIHRPWAVLF
ncbi:MAG: hypothetical protein EAZ89_16590 [Bacteroidetes bacterium]|nr:MAG: hypothetical protein EAZ89_16590 [Bacteroidota bacterium]